MVSTIEKYQIATEQFLNNFDLYWNNMLNELDTKQIQLVSGNRLRPQICLWGYLATVSPCDVTTHNFNQIANVAVSIEMIHKASLLLDDWIDEDKERHGHQTFYIEYGAEYTVLLALNIIGLSMQRLKNVFPESTILPQHYNLCLDTIIKTICAMAKGALEELRLTKAELFDNQKIREIIQLETSDILGNSLLLGYYTGSGNNAQVEKIFKRIGDQCGYLFQALNDLEAFENPQQLKHHKGTVNLDIFSNRKNIAISTLYAIASKKDKDALQAADEKELLRLMEKYHIVDLIKSELENVYENVLSESAILNTAGLPNEWCDGLKGFLAQVKKFAEARL